MTFSRDGWVDLRLASVGGDWMTWDKRRFNLLEESLSRRYVFAGRGIPPSRCVLRTRLGQMMLHPGEPRCYLRDFDF